MTNDNDARGALTAREQFEQWWKDNLQDAIHGRMTSDAGLTAWDAWQAAKKLPAGDGLTDEQLDKFVADLVEYGTEFVAPLYAVVEQIERTALAAPRQPVEMDAGVQTQDALRWIMRQAESAKEPCSDNPESPAAIRNGKLAGIATAAAQALGLVRGPSYAASAQQDEREATRIEQLRKALFEARDAMRVMSNWVKKSDPAGHSWAVHMVDRANNVLSHAGAAQQVQADAGAVDIDAAERAAFESTNDSDNVAMYKHWFRKGFKAGSARPAAESDKMWRWRYETLRALFPSAPSEEELDIAIRAAMSRDTEDSNG